MAARAWYVNEYVLWGLWFRSKLELFFPFADSVISALHATSNHFHFLCVVAGHLKDEAYSYGILPWWGNRRRIWCASNPSLRRRDSQPHIHTALLGISHLAPGGGDSCVDRHSDLEAAHPWRTYSLGYCRQGVGGAVLY